jgi:soluble cytochrome b562
MTAEDSTATAVVTETVTETPVVEVAEAQKPVEEKPTESIPVEPQTLDLKIPEGSLLPVEHVEKIKTWAQENKVSPEEAQKALERDSSTWKAFHESQVQTVKKTIEAWPNELKADKDFGGEKFKETVDLASRVLDKFGDADFKKQLQESGLGNNPGLLKWAARVGRAMKNDELIMGKSTTAPVLKPTAQVLYGPKEGTK